MIAADGKLSQVHILLPPLQKLRTVVDRLKVMSDVLIVRANNSKHLQLSVNTDSVRCETLWTDCTNPKMSMPFSRYPIRSLNLRTARAQTNSQDPTMQEDNDTDPDKMHTVQVPIRGFLKFLHSHVVSTTSIACISASTRVIYLD